MPPALLPFFPSWGWRLTARRNCVSSLCPSNLSHRDAARHWSCCDQKTNPKSTPIPQIPCKFPQTAQHHISTSLFATSIKQTDGNTSDSPHEVDTNPREIFSLSLYSLSAPMHCAFPGEGGNIFGYRQPSEAVACKRNAEIRR